MGLVVLTILYHETGLNHQTGLNNDGCNETGKQWDFNCCVLPFSNFDRGLCESLFVLLLLSNAGNNMVDSPRCTRTPPIAAVVVVEQQKRGLPHFHSLTERHGGHTNVDKPTNVEAKMTAAYIGKYMHKGADMGIADGGGSGAGA